MITAKILAYCLIGTAIAAVSIPAASHADDIAQPTAAAAPPLYQLRVYQLFEPSKALFHRRFRDQAMRLMRGHGFDIVATWEGRRDGKPEFVYLLRWPDQAAKDRAWKAFLDDPAWKAIKAATVSPDAPIMGEIEDHAMTLTDYSPPFEPQKR